MVQPWYIQRKIQWITHQISYKTIYSFLIKGKLLRNVLKLHFEAIFGSKRSPRSAFVVSLSVCLHYALKLFLGSKPTKSPSKNPSKKNPKEDPLRRIPKEPSKNPPKEPQESPKIPKRAPKALEVLVKYKMPSSNSVLSIKIWWYYYYNIFTVRDDFRFSLS